MRIIIEMTDVESRSMTIQPETAPGKSAAATPAEPLDGGQPAEGLVLALGAKPQAGAKPGNGNHNAADAGQPPDWLIEAVPGRPPM